MLIRRQFPLYTDSIQLINRQLRLCKCKQLHVTYCKCVHAGIYYCILITLISCMQLGYLQLANTVQDRSQMWCSTVTQLLVPRVHADSYR